MYCGSGSGRYARAVRGELCYSGAWFVRRIADTIPDTTRPDNQPNSFLIAEFWAARERECRKLTRVSRFGWERLFVLGRWLVKEWLAIAATILAVATISTAFAQNETLTGPMTTNKSAGKPVTMNVDDFVVDRNTLVGKVVAVTGSASCINGDFCSLSSPDSPMTNVVFSASKLNREDRKRLLSCNPFSDPCIATVTGKATSEMMASIKADAITFAPTDEDRAAADPSLPPCNKVDPADIKGLAADSPLAKMLHLEITGVTIESWSDTQGHMHCTAQIISNAGEKTLRYYLKREGDQTMILGAWTN